MGQQRLVGLVYNAMVPEARKLVESFRDSLGLTGRSWLSTAESIDVGDDLLSRTEAIITAGGDGTILRAVRVAAPHSVPILGINLGRVGFMTELSVAEAADRIPAYLEGAHRVEVRMMLQASVIGDSGEPNIEVHALNDVVVSRGAVPRLLDIDVRVSGVPLTTYRADGVIVSTATGSTGYALAAGGPTLYPEAREILIQPVATHMGLHTGLIVPEDSVVELTVHADDEAGLSVDSFTDASLSRGDRVVVQRSPYEARFLRAGPPSDFYRTVTQRFGILDRPARNR
jgi:NAD+ kinase